MRLKRGKLSEIDVSLARAMSANGTKSRRIAEMLNVAACTISSIARTDVVLKARLDADDARLLHSLRSKGTSSWLLAEMFGVSPNAVSTLAAGKTYRHLGLPIIPGGSGRRSKRPWTAPHIEGL